MIVTSSSSANVFLASAQPPQTRPERAKPELPLPEPNTTISAAGQLRSALERLGAATLEPGNTSVFAPKPLSTEKSAEQNADQEREAQQRQPSPADQLPPAFIPAAPPPPDIKPEAASTGGVDTVSLQQFISEGEKFSLRLNEQRKLSDRAAGVFDAESTLVPRKTSSVGETAAPTAERDGIKRAPSLAASASTKEPTPNTSDAAAPSVPVLAPLPAPAPEPAPKSVPAAARELASAVNELRAAVNRTENSASNNAASNSNEAATRGLKVSAERALAAVERQAPALQRVGIERNAQGALEVNEPKLQTALANAPQQVQQALDAARHGIAAEIEPVVAQTATAGPNIDNTDNLSRVLREVPTAPRRTETPAPATLPELPVLAEQAQRLGKTLDSIVSTGVQLQRELVREDAQSSSQSSLINRLNTIANALTP